MTFFDRWVLGLLAFYQRFISPYKGFCCAYGVYTGHSTCSAMAKKIILQKGIVRGLPSIRQQLRDCQLSMWALNGEILTSTEDQARLDRLNRIRRSRDRRNNQDKSDRAECCVENGCELGSNMLPKLDCAVCDCSF